MLGKIELGLKFAPIIMRGMQDILAPLTDEEKQTMNTLVAYVVDQAFILATTEDEAEKRRIMGNLEHAKSAMESFEAIKHVRVYNRSLRLAKSLLLAALQVALL